MSNKSGKSAKKSSSRQSRSSVRSDPDASQLPPSQMSNEMRMKVYAKKLFANREYCGYFVYRNTSNTATASNGSSGRKNSQSSNMIKSGSKTKSKIVSKSKGRSFKSKSNKSIKSSKSSKSTGITGKSSGKLILTTPKSTSHQIPISSSSVAPQPKTCSTKALHPIASTLGSAIFGKPDIDDLDSDSGKPSLYLIRQTNYKASRFIVFSLASGHNQRIEPCW